MGAVKRFMDKVFESVPDQILYQIHDRMPENLETPSTTKDHIDVLASVFDTWTVNPERPEFEPLNNEFNRQLNAAAKPYGVTIGTSKVNCTINWDCPSLHDAELQVLGYVHVEFARRAEKMITWQRRAGDDSWRDANSRPTAERAVFKLNQSPPGIDPAEVYIYATAIPFKVTESTQGTAGQPNTVRYMVRITLFSAEGLIRQLF